ncbi:hypothetical protein AB0H00_30055 [Nocardia sp. NPDC023852]|uniref:hypothetical protein n=1 Tax=Nocardia sp. NPDC023852 TaxID=3154697 RepID=UPI0033CF1C94
MGDGEFVLSSNLTGVEIAAAGVDCPIECQGRPGWKWFLSDGELGPGDPKRGAAICQPVDDNDFPSVCVPMEDEMPGAQHIVLVDSLGGGDERDFMFHFRPV